MYGIGFSITDGYSVRPSTIHLKHFPKMYKFIFLGNSAIQSLSGIVEIHSNSALVGYFKIPVLKLKFLNRFPDFNFGGGVFIRNNVAGLPDVHCSFQ